MNYIFGELIDAHAHVVQDITYDSEDSTMGERSL